MHSLTSAKKESKYFEGHQEQEDEQEKKKRNERKKNDNYDKHMDKDEDVINVIFQQITFSVFSKTYLVVISFQDITLPKLRTCAKFAVTSVSRVASTAVRANGIVAERVHVTKGW